jgi:hypothetical protein
MEFTYSLSLSLFLPRICSREGSEGTKDRKDWLYKVNLTKLCYIERKEFKGKEFNHECGRKLKFIVICLKIVLDKNISHFHKKKEKNGKYIAKSLLKLH